MRSTRNSYVHRGDGERLRRRVRYGLILVGLLTAVGITSRDRGPREATAAPLFGGEAGRLRRDLDSARGDLELANAQLSRWHRIFAYSSRFHIPADLAGSIFDVALAEGIEPELAFRLVSLESDFKERATSRVGAVGLTQLMPSTARFFDGRATRERLYDRELNLRIGFRYLRTLITEYGGSVKLALLVYNRGPTAVASSRQSGQNPSNGYDRLLLKGFKGKATVD